MPQWEFKALEICFDEKVPYGLELGPSVRELQKPWEYLASLGKAGWELVSVAPIMSSKRKGGIADRLVEMDPHYGTVMVGYSLWFKRPVAVSSRVDG